MTGQNQVSTSTLRNREEFDARQEFWKADSIANAWAEKPLGWTDGVGQTSAADPKNRAVDEGEGSGTRCCFETDGGGDAERR